jgi:hypothetical protein
MMMPEHVRELIKFQLARHGLAPELERPDGIGYVLHYASGLRLFAMAKCLEKRGLLGKRPYLYLAVYDYDAGPPKRDPVLAQRLKYPYGPNDLQFCLRFTNKFIAMTRAVADTLDGGICLDFDFTTATT